MKASIAPTEEDTPRMSRHLTVGNKSRLSFSMEGEKLLTPQPIKTNFPRDHVSSLNSSNSLDSSDFKSDASTILYTSEFDISKAKESEDSLLESLNRYTLYNLVPDSVVNPSFVNEREVENDNIRYSSSGGSSKDHDILYMSINLFLKKIALENFADSKSNQLLVQSFIEQCSSFLCLNVLFEKIISLYYYLVQKQNKNIVSLMYFTSKLIYQYNKEILEDEILRQKLSKVFEEMLTLNVFNNKEKSDATTVLFFLKSKQVRLSKMQDFFGIQPKKDEFVNRFPRKNTKGYFILTDWKPTEIARQLTVISYSLLSQIKQEEVLAAKFSKKDKYINSPNVFKVIERCDNLILFIVEDIISYDYASTRAEMITKWINVAEKCQEMNNFTDCLFIIAAFHNYMLQALKQTWSLVSDETKAKMQTITDFCSCRKGYANIKQKISQCLKEKQAFIPYLGLLLKEITSLEENMKYIQDKTLINFGKIKRISNAISSFFKFKQIKYKFNSVEDLEFLKSPLPLEEEKLRILTSKLEPSFALDRKKTTIKRKTNTDLNYQRVINFHKITITNDYFQLEQE